MAKHKINEKPKRNIFQIIYFVVFNLVFIVVSFCAVYSAYMLDIQDNFSEFLKSFLFEIFFKK
jgi:hypothetical protein